MDCTRLCFHVFNAGVAEIQAAVLNILTFNFNIAVGHLVHGWAGSAPTAQPGVNHSAHLMSFKKCLFCLEKTEKFHCCNRGFCPRKKLAKPTACRNKGPKEYYSGGISPSVPMKLIKDIHSEIKQKS